MLATLQRDGSKPLAVFGLPGNPCAAAATLRFLVHPFLRLASDRQPEAALFKAKLLPDKNKIKHSAAPLANGLANGKPLSQLPRYIHKCGEGKAAFRSYILARFQGFDDAGYRLVRLLERGSGMVRPLAEADCWILLKEGQEEEEGSLFDCFLLDRAL